jgi:hypothetical protein
VQRLKVEGHPSHHNGCLLIRPVKAGGNAPLLLVLLSLSNHPCPAPNLGP